MTRIPLALVMASIALGADSGAQDSETQAKLQNLPAAVRQAVKAQSQGATLRGFAKEVKGGVILYEAELTINGRTRDITFDERGKVVSIEAETTLDEIPAGARAAIEKAVGAGKLALVEEVTKGETTFYEAHVTDGHKTSEVKVDAHGKPVE